ncbi:hypothetical protein [Kribbella sp. NPDC006257]|uniref:hypothetical protein n=1 Tax=Kribbella sp. NPDC006257 TaxID=3156738 RepID=UPI0033A9883E
MAEKSTADAANGDEAFPGLRAAFYDWASQAIASLSGTRPEDSIDPRRWKRGDDGIFRHGDHAVRVWGHDAVNQLMRTATWRAVESAFKQDDRLLCQLNALVGTPMGFTRFDSERAGRLVLPRPDEVEDFDAAFARRYQKLDDFLAATELEQSVVWPVPGLWSDLFPITLEQDLELDLMSDEELTAALEGGLVPLSFGRTQILTDEDTRSACMRHRYRVPKIVGGAMQSAEQHNELEHRLRVHAERLQNTLALLFPEPVAVAGRLSRETHNPLGGWTSYSPADVTRAQVSRSLCLDGTKTAELRDVWLRLSRPNLNKALALALRRLSYQAGRERLEDELVDVLVAAEALYLSDAGYNELSFRLALRAAAFCKPEQLGMGRRDVFETMRSAYNVRSKIVHGESPKSSDLVVCGSVVSLVEFVQAIEDIVRQGLREAVAWTADPARSWPPDWDGLTLPTR